MPYIEFRYSKSALNKAGAALIDETSSETDQDQAKDILDNWRACHAASLNSFQASLRARLKNSDSLISQRLKRTPSIISKLRRNPAMSLARMQDIGGIRIIANNMTDVRSLERIYKKNTPAFSLVGDGKDYINTPKHSGYRSIHQIYKCKNGFSIELQIRTKIQHAWATAVETMGTFLNLSLKSSEGPEEWLEFFSLASSAFAVLESTPRIQKYENLSDQETFELMLKKEKDLDVLSKLSGFRVAAKNIIDDKKKGKYHLITLDLDRRMANIKSYKAKDILQANIDYSEREREISLGKNIQAVLVASESIKSLKKAYPSYFLDSENFSNHIKSIKKKLLRSTLPKGKL